MNLKWIIPNKQLRAFVRLQRLRWRQRRRPMPTAVRLVSGLGGLIVLGTFLLMLPFVGAERPLHFNEAMFTAASALSVTGLSIITPVHDLSLIGQIILLLLIQVGGVGFMVGAVLIFRVLGRRITLVDRLTLTDSLGLLVPGAILNLTRRVLITVFLIESVGAILLWFNWHEELGDRRAAFYAIFHAVSAFCNAGFDLFNGLPEYPEGLPRDTWTLTVMGVLIFLGGLGIPVLADLITWPRGHRFTLHTRITLVVVIALIIAGGVGVFFAERRIDGVLASEPWWRQLLMSMFQSVSARTAGFAGVANFELLSPASQLLLIVLMFIGCAPASMGGGITTGTLATLMLALWGYARGLPTAQIGKRSLAVGTMRKAAAVLTISLFVVLLASWLILMTHDAPLNVVVFEVVSAFATCGLSLQFTDELNLFGQLIIALMMFWGRLGALTIVVAIAQQRRSQPFAYPEEQILIG